MYIKNLNNKEILKDLNYNKENKYLILCELKDLEEIKEKLNLDEDTFNKCLSFDEDIKLDVLEEYDFLSVNTFCIENDRIKIKEANIYLSDNFILVVCDKNYFLNEIVLNIINDSKRFVKYSEDEILFMINYNIFRNIIINQFESLEKLEDIILQIEDDMMNKIDNNYIENINYVRNMSRVIVRNIRPFIYICDKLFNENNRYKKPLDLSIQNVDFSVEKLYAFSLSTRELSDKLLDIYSSNISKKTNDLITKLTLLTAISSPLTIITGIYGMNFKYMPELNSYYGYPVIIGIMIFIIIFAISIFKFKKFL